MDGRCETDAFDYADDVCGSCYGEYCQACLVQSGKKPLCQDCALTISGVRPGKIPQRGDKKSVKARRKAIKARAAEGRPSRLGYGPGGAAQDDAAVRGSATDDGASTQPKERRSPAGPGYRSDPLAPLKALANFGNNEDRVN